MKNEIKPLFTPPEDCRPHGWLPLRANYIFDDILKKNSEDYGAKELKPIGFVTILFWCPNCDSVLDAEKKLKHSKIIPDPND